MEELDRTVKKFVNLKAVGVSGVLPEMMKYIGGSSFVRCWPWCIKVPLAWKDMELGPVPKKGDLTVCDNWRGNALLDVVGKAIGQLIQSRLQQLAECALPDAQCGFRSDWFCTDQIFAVRQIVEKLYEHRNPGFLVFIDLQKSYYSIPREAM